MSRIRVAVIGGGNMGKNHVRNYADMQEVELVGLADIDPVTEDLANQYGAKFFTDYEEMINELNPDAVSIVVPTPLHYKMAKTVMSMGIHCLVEKPISSTVDQADELIEIAKRGKLVFTVGHIEHYNPVVIKLKELVDSGELGRITSVVAKRVGGLPRIEPKTDVILDLAVHDIGIINYLLGRAPVNVHSHGSRTYHSKEMDSAEIMLDYGDASGLIQANWVTPVKVRHISITGSNGYVEANYITQELQYYKHNISGSAKNYSDYVASLGEPETRSIKVDFEEPLALELKRFISNVKKPGSSVIVSPIEGRDALAVAIEASNNCSREDSSK